MTNPYSSGGGGTHLEARIVAYCLVAVLCEVPSRGLLGNYAVRARTQRADFGDKLDDIIIDGVRADGRSTKLHLQIKNQLSFTDKDGEWVDILRRAWDTVSQPDFDRTLHRVGVGIGVYHARADQHYQSVLRWAAESSDAAHFIERIEKGDYSHEAKRTFVSDIRYILATHLGREFTTEELWKLLQSFVILHFDFQNQGGSRDNDSTLSILRQALPATRCDDAPNIWNFLIAKAGTLVPAGGGATRETLAAALTAQQFELAAAPYSWRDIETLDRESRRAVADIKDSIQGLRLHRAAAYESIRIALAEARFVQINGEPGCGKSALLKHVAEECGHNGPIFFLKDARIHPRGWTAHARVLGVSDDIAALLREFGRAGEPILFIDGIDKIMDPAAQLTINDVLRTIVSHAELSAWRVLVTIRQQNLKHLETWLDPDTLKKLPIKTVDVGALSDNEVSLVAEAFPRLRPLVIAGSSADVILKRPFFLAAILSLGAQADIAALPATEIELLKLWWQLGASDRPDFTAAQQHRNALLELAERLARVPAIAISIRDIDPSAIEELRVAGVIRDQELGHSVAFAHDIYEEWALCQLLIGLRSDLAGAMKSFGEPDLLLRPTQLLGVYSLEEAKTADAWKALYESTGDQSLRPIWQRAILTASLHSTRTTELLQRISDYLMENEGARLRRLLLALSTTEVLPNPIFLDESRTPNLDPAERAKYALLTAVPKALTWVRFLDWLMPKVNSLSPVLIPDLVSIFATWQKSYSGRRVRHCREIGELSYAWLAEIESATHPEDFKDYRTPFGISIADRDLEKKVRALFLASAGDVVALAKEYLAAKLKHGRMVHVFRGEIISHCIELIRHIPKELVDFVLEAFLEHPKDREREGPFGSYKGYHELESLGLDDRFAFYPASPVQLPFLMLLRLHEQEGLRLVRSLCNFAVDVWRWGFTQQQRSPPLEPLPIALTFSWGEQNFFGDGHAYMWFRGMWGSHACESALMALEQWALEKLEAGASFEEIFRAGIEGNESVSALGLGVSLCLAYPAKAAAAALPLITCPALWQWDVQRYVHDIGLPSNEIGNWHQYRPQLEAVRVLNQKPHRKQDIRNLIPYILLSGNDRLIEKFTEGVRSFPERPPILFKEELTNADHMAELTNQMKIA